MAFIEAQANKMRLKFKVKKHYKTSKSSLPGDRCNQKSQHV